MRTKPFKNNRGVSLVELLIVIAVGTMVFGLILGILVNTSAAVEKKMKYESVVSKTESVLENISSDINNVIIDPTLVTKIIEKNPKAYRFSANQLGFWCAENKEGDSYHYVDLFNKPGEVSNIMKGIVGFESNERDDKVVGVNFEDVSTQVSFRYAKSFNAGKPEWKDSLPDGEYPKLIEVKVKAFSSDEDVKPLEIVSVYNFN